MLVSTVWVVGALSFVAGALDWAERVAPKNTRALMNKMCFIGDVLSKPRYVENRALVGARAVFFADVGKLHARS